MASRALIIKDCGWGVVLAGEITIRVSVHKCCEKKKLLIGAARLLLLLLLAAAAWPLQTATERFQQPAD